MAKSMKNNSPNFTRAFLVMNASHAQYGYEWLHVQHHWCENDFKKTKKDLFNPKRPSTINVQATMGVWKKDSNFMTNPFTETICISFLSMW